MSLNVLLVFLIFWNIYLQSEMIMLRNSVEHCLQSIGNTKSIVNMLREELEKDDGK